MSSLCDGASLVTSDDGLGAGPRGDAQQHRSAPNQLAVSAFTFASESDLLIAIPRWLTNLGALPVNPRECAGSALLTDALKQ
jgi:hypothetical protein